MKINKRTRFVSGIYIAIFILVFSIIAGRFLYIQASGQVSNVSLKQLAKQKRATYNTLSAERGKIFDANGMILANDRPTYKMYAILSEDYTLNSKKPKHVVDINTTAEKLAPILEEDQSTIFETLTNGVEAKKWQVEFGHAGKGLSQKEKEEIEQLNLPGINFEQQAIRYYPNGTFASHIIGFARKDNQSSENEEDDEQIIGVTGIENEMNDLLVGEDGYVSYDQDGYLSKLLHPDETVQQPKDGHDIHLTIDQKVQTIVEDMLTQVEEEYEPERITAVVMNAKTGEILAMSNRPSYNPNNPVGVENWYNDIISTPFEPGSTVKMFTWAAAIDEGVYQGDEQFKSGSYQINQAVQPIRDHNRGEGWGKISFDEGFIRSSNVAASKLVWEKLEPDRYLDYLEKFDFDKKTNIDLPGEVAGQILYNWPIEKLTTSFGQGSTITPIQQIKAATAIANGGEMLQPYVIKKVVDRNTGETIEEKEPSVINKPISEETAEQMLSLLEGVVHSEDGTGKTYQLDDYTLAGKTGTAEIPNPDGAGYLSGKENIISSFLGMAPADDPELMMYVSVSKPKLDDHELSSYPVSHIFKNVMENSLRYLNIRPDKESDQLYQTVTIPKIIDQDTDATTEKLSDLGLNVTVVGDGMNITKANVTEDTEMFTNDHVLLITDNPLMPDIEGWSLRDTLQLTHLMELKVETIGTGYVTHQSIKEGVPLKPEDYLGVELEPPNNDEDVDEADANAEE